MTSKLLADLLSQYSKSLRELDQDVSLKYQQQEDDNYNKSPLINRVRKLLAALSHEEKINGIELLELQVRLKGRKGGRAHVGEIAECLRKLGYQRHRGWLQGRDSGFCSRWYPPSI